MCAGSSVLFNVGASGNGLKYQWYKNGTPLVGRTNSSINLASVGATDVANYCVVVGTACGGAVTNCAMLDLNVPVSASALEDVAVCAGGHVRFSTRDHRGSPELHMDEKWYGAFGKVLQFP